MKLHYLILATIPMTGAFLYGQVGINTENPITTLHVNSSPTDLTKTDGLIIPNITGDELRIKSNLYGSDQNSTMVFVTVADSNPSGKTINVLSSGYYYYDSLYSIWKKIDLDARNGLSKNEDAIELGGQITKPTTLSNVSDINKLSITGTGIDAINIDENTVSVDATNNRVGLGTITPLQTLDIEGTARLSQTQTNNVPTNLLTNHKPLYISTTDGSIKYAPEGFNRTVGGFRPGKNKVLAKLPKNNTIARVRFVCYVDNSNELNNSVKEAYVYGDFTIIGLGSSSLIRFVDVSIKGYDGNSRSLVTNSPTEIRWDANSQGYVSITIDQDTGELKIDDGSTGIFSYFFEIMGGT